MKFREHAIPKLRPGLILNAVYPAKKCKVELIEPDSNFRNSFGWKCNVIEIIEWGNYRRGYAGHIESVFRHEFTDSNWKPYFKPPVDK
jgi:hypothetical protein